MYISIFSWSCSCAYIEWMKMNEQILSLPLSLLFSLPTCVSCTERTWTVDASERARERVNKSPSPALFCLFSGSTQRRTEGQRMQKQANEHENERTREHTLVSFDGCPLLLSLSLSVCLYVCVCLSLSFSNSTRRTSHTQPFKVSTPLFWPSLRPFTRHEENPASHFSLYVSSTPIIEFFSLGFLSIYLDRWAFLLSEREKTIPTNNIETKTTKKKKRKARWRWSSSPLLLDQSLAITSRWVFSTLAKKQKKRFTSSRCLLHHHYGSLLKLAFPAKKTIRAREKNQLGSQVDIAILPSQ